MLNILVPFFLSRVYLGTGSLGHRICVCSARVDTAMQLPEVVVPAYTFTSRCIRVCIGSNCLPTFGIYIFAFYLF